MGASPSNLKRCIEDEFARLGGTTRGYLVRILNPSLPSFSQSLTVILTFCSDWLTLSPPACLTG